MIGRLSQKLSISWFQAVLITYGTFLVFQAKWISDDGYIYFRYIDNLVVHKLGLVFNAGEFVEGFTSPLWVGLLSVLRWLPTDLSFRHLVIIIGCTVAAFTFFLLARTNNHIITAENPKITPALNLSVPLALALSTQVVPEFFTSGLETPLVMLYTVFAGSQFLLPSKKPWKVGLLIGLGPLVRPELAIISGLLWLQYLMQNGTGWGKLTLTAIIPNLAYLVFRIWYYASLLPNTYYAKANSGPYWEQGFHYLQNLLDSYHSDLIFIILICGITLQYLLAKKASKLIGNRIWILIAIISFSTYVISVGGDFMHGRFWIPVLILLYLNCAGITEFLLNKQKLISLHLPQSIKSIAGTLIIIACLSPFQAPELDDRGQLIADERAWYMKKDEHHLSDWNFEANNDWADIGKDMKALAEATQMPIVFLKGAIGYASYYAGPQVSVIDRFGLVDLAVARKELKKRDRPGHEKQASAAYVLWRRPTIWWTPFEEYNQAFQFIPGEGPLTNFNPEFISRLEKTYGRNITWPAESAVIRLLNRKHLDPNLLYLLKTLYAPYAREGMRNWIEVRYRNLPQKPSWEQWTIDNQEALKWLEQQKRNQHHFWENLNIAFESHKLNISP